MIEIIMQSIYFTFPAYIANMLPVIAKRTNILEFLNKPIDLNKKYSNKRELFGKNKTYRGIVVAIIGGMIGTFLQKLAYSVPMFNSISITNYNSWLIIGALMGAGAIIGDLIKSFFKRRIGIGSGKKFIPFDQIDFVIGSYLFILPIFYSILTIQISFWNIFIAAIFVSFVLHIIVNHISYYFKIRKEKW